MFKLLHHHDHNHNRCDDEMFFHKGEESVHIQRLRRSQMSNSFCNYSSIMTCICIQSLKHSQMSKQLTIHFAITAALLWLYCDTMFDLELALIAQWDVMLFVQAVYIIVIIKIMSYYAWPSAYISTMKRQLPPIANLISIGSNWIWEETKFHPPLSPQEIIAST